MNTASQAISREDMAKMAENAGAAARLLKLMGNQNRLMILCTLLDGELSVGQLNDVIPLSQSSLSQHLAELRKASLVSTRREAQTIYYRIQGHHALEVIKVLKKLFCEDL